MSDAAPLVHRICAGRTDLVFDHVATGGRATAVDARGTSILEWCAYYGDVSAIRFLIAHGEVLERLGADLGLNAAAFHGHWQLCQFLLERGAPVNGVASETGETPLHSSMCSDDRARYDAVMRVLLASGADPNAATVPGAETGAFMRDCRTRGETSLHRAAAFGRVETVQTLLDHGARLDARDANGDTPLTWASWARRPPEILRLLTFGDFRIHPRHRGLREHLVGDPFRHRHLPSDSGARTLPATPQRISSVTT